MNDRTTISLSLLCGVHSFRGSEDNCDCEHHPHTHIVITIVTALPNNLSSLSFRQFACSAAFRRSAEASDRQTAGSPLNKSTVFITAPTSRYSFKSFYHEPHI